MSCRIAEIRTVSGLGMRKSSVMRVGNDPRDYGINITWDSERDYEEQEQAIVCFTAIDSRGSVVFCMSTCTCTCFSHVR